MNINKTLLSATLLTALVASAVGYGRGYAEGVSAGQKGMHNGEMQCATMPDNTVYCWRLKK